MKIENLEKLDNEQLDVLSRYIDSEIEEKLYSSIDETYTNEQMEIIAKALKLNIDVTDILNPRLKKESMIILCDAKLKGIDIKGLDNVYIDENTLKQLIQIKMNTKIDMTFIKSLSEKECKEFIKNFIESIKNNTAFNIQEYMKKTNIERDRKLAEIKYSIAPKKIQ